jgi:hypothetical protein
MTACGSCQGCFKRRARDSFVERWEARFPNGPSAAEALAQAIAPMRNGPFLEEAFAEALERGADIEAFRDAARENGAAEFLRDRDTRWALLAPAGKPKSDKPPVPKKREIYRDHGYPSPTVAGVRALLSTPRFRGGGWHWTHTTWTERDHHELWVLCWARAPMERVAATLGRSPTSIAHHARDAGLNLPLDWRLVIAAPKAIRKAALPMAYPFIREVREEHTLTMKVNAFIPRGVPGREDACQAVLLALTEGTITEDMLVGSAGAANRRRFLKAMRKENFEMGGYARSLDAPLGDGDDRTLLDKLAC